MKLFKTTGVVIATLLVIFPWFVGTRLFIQASSRPALEESTTEEVTTDFETETETETVTETETETVTETEPETTTEEITTEYVEPFRYYDFLSMSYDLQQGIFDIAKKYEVNYELLLAWAIQEASGNENCKGDYYNGEYHAYGLYQVQPQWWEWLAYENGLYDYRTNGVQNCELAVIILMQNLEKTNGDLDKAFSLYRHGLTDSCVEPDGITYEQHIYDYMQQIIEGEQI